MNTKITFVELVDLLSESTSTTNRVCELFLRELFSTISKTLIKGKPVKVKGIGEFKVVESAPRKDTDEISHKRITFTPDKSLADALNEPFAQFKTIILDDAVTDEKLAEIDARYPSMVIPPPSEEDLPPVEDITRVAQAQAAAALDESQTEDMPEKVEIEPAPAPEPEPDLIPAAEPGLESKPEHVEKPISEPKTKPGPAMAKSIEKNPVERKPMLIGIPIDGPTQPVPEPEQTEEDMSKKRFYRPELRNTYTPTPEQIEEANRKPDRRWWWPLLAVLAVGAIMWWLFSNSDSGSSSDSENQVVLAADTISDSDTAGLAEAKPKEQQSVEKAVKEELAKKEEREKQAEKAVKEEIAKNNAKKDVQEKPAATNQKQVTDVVTSQIVLTTLAEKHYGSPWFWVYIYEENKAIISNPNNIKPGTRVVIPPPEKYGINPNDKASLKKAQVKSWQYLKGK